MAAKLNHGQEPGWLFCRGSYTIIYMSYTYIGIWYSVVLYYSRYLGLIMAQWESLSNYQSTKTRWMPLSNVSVPLAICVLRASWCGPWRWGPRRCLAGQLRMGYVSFSWIVWANMFRNMMDCVDVCFLWNIMEYLYMIYIYIYYYYIWYYEYVDDWCRIYVFDYHVIF